LAAFLGAAFFTGFFAAFFLLAFAMMVLVFLVCYRCIMKVRKIFHKYHHLTRVIFF
jgi:hypothetical protein